MKKHYEAVPVEEELPPIGAKITFLDHLGEATTMVITGLDEEIRTNRTYFEFWLREVGSSVSTEDVQGGFSKSDIEKVCFAIRKRIVEANGTDKYLLTSGNEFIHAVWNEIAELPVRQQVVSTEDIIEMIDKIIEDTTLTGIDLGHRGNTRGMESCDYILGELNKLRSRLTAKEKGK